MVDKRNNFLKLMNLLGCYKMQYSGNEITTEEELDVELKHFEFLNKYRLL